MNEVAEQHCSRARDYIAKGDEFYRKAKPEIDAAKDAGASVDEMCRYLHKSRRWVYDVLAWDGQGTLYESDTEARQLRQAKQVLRELPPEQLADDLLSDPQINRNLTSAALVHEEKSQDKARREQRERAPQLVARAGLNEVLSGLIKAKLGLAHTLRELQQVPEFSSEDRTDLIDIVAEIKLEVDWIESFLTSGTTDMDSELEALLAEGGQ